MKNIILLSVVLSFLVGCSDTAVSGGGEVSTITIGLKNRGYRYVELISENKQIGVFYTGEVEHVETYWLEVPDVDTVTLIPVDSDCKYYRIHSVQDSVYRLN